MLQREEPTEKQCSICKELLPIDRFPIRSQTKKHTAYCKSCQNKWNQALRAKRVVVIDSTVIEKECCNCKQVLPLSEFYRHKAMKHGVVPRCKECRREQKRAYDAAHPEVVRKINLKLNYGITQEKYDALEKKQGGCCAICGADEKLVVDHNHQRGKNVRGLLCNHCNWLIGFARERISILEQAAAYLYCDEHPEVSMEKVRARVVFEVE